MRVLSFFGYQFSFSSVFCLQLFLEHVAELKSMNLLLGRNSAFFLYPILNFSKKIGVHGALLLSYIHIFEKCSNILLKVKTVLQISINLSLNPIKFWKLRILFRNPKKQLQSLVKGIFCICVTVWGLLPESNESFIEFQAFLRSYDSAPRPSSSPPPSPVSNLLLFLSLPVCRRSSLLKGEWGGKGWAKN